MVLHCLQAMRLSAQHADGSESDSSDDSSGDGDNAAAQPPVVQHGLSDESQLAALLTVAEREKYDKRLEDEEKAGWTCVHSAVVQPHAFDPPPQGPWPTLCTCTSPLHFFHAILPLSFFDFVVERMNDYAALRQDQKRENRPPAASTRARPEPMASWANTSAREVLAFVGCMLCMGICNVGNTRDY